MFSPDYCCCAIPLVNVGIYTLMSEQFTLATVAGVLALVTPTIVGGHAPSYTPYILSALCFIIAAIQLIGFYGVFKEQIRTFRYYAVFNGIAFGLAFACGAALVGVSAAGHDTAVTACEEDYYTSANTTSTTTTSGEGSAVCEAFAWADIGIMGGLWLVLLVVQGYLIFITRVYSNHQKDDHQKYKSIYSQNLEEFRLSQFYGGPNAEAWDHRPSVESLRDAHSPYYAGEPVERQSYVGSGLAREYSSASMQVPETEEGSGAGTSAEGPAYEYEQAQHDAAHEQQQAGMAGVGGGNRYSMHGGQFQDAQEGGGYDNHQQPGGGYEGHQYEGHGGYAEQAPGGYADSPATAGGYGGHAYSERVPPGQGGQRY